MWNFSLHSNTNLLIGRPIQILYIFACETRRKKTESQLYQSHGWGAVQPEFNSAVSSEQSRLEICGISG